MAFLPAKDAEPIPGYRLVEKLGVGGYGEVWKVIAPGGLAKAVKIIYGDMSGSRADQELKALGRIKEVRHPFLLSLERIEILDGQLFIVTELADGCLLDRFYECRKKGLKGIARDELLGHMRDAADALDYMSETYGLQHLDIKPQNLLLVGNRVKVADFGLVKDVIGTSATAPGGVTPVYATPEAFDGRVSRYSDQYSLAIVYQEMLTGVRPFPGTTLMQLVAQHVSGQPLLTPLPANDRIAIAKALSKAPEQRYPSCLKMVDALLAGGRAAEVIPVSPSQRLEQPEHDLPGTAASLKTLSESLGDEADLDLKTIQKTSPAERREAAGTPRPGRGQAPRAVVPGKPGLRPTLFLGIGGLAAATLRRLKKRLRERFGGLEETPIYRLLLVDTDREDLRRARLGDPAEALDLTETLLAPLHLPEHYRPQSKKLLRWLDRRWLYGIPRSLQTEALRPLGRLALVDNAADLLPQIRDVLAQITSAEAIGKTVNITGAEIRDETPRVFLVASATGGTGSGMAVTMAYAVRQALGELGLSGRGLCGLLLYATSPKPAEQEISRVNACATLGEVDHFSRPGSAYPGDPEYGLAPFHDGQAPFEECYLVHLGEQLGMAEVQAAADAPAEYLFLDSCPQGGAFLDQFRLQTQATPRDPEEPATLRTFGLTRIGVQGERPLESATKLLCRRLTQKWLAGPGEAETQFLEREAQRQAAAHGLEELPLSERLQTVVASALGVSTEAYCTKLLDRAAKIAGSDQPPRLLDPIDRVFAVKADAEEGAELPGVPLQAPVRKAASDRGAEIGRALVDWMIRLVETPGKRFRAAERAASFLMREIAALADVARERHAEVVAQRAAFRRHIETAKPGAKASSFRWFGRSSEAIAPKTEEKLPEYLHLWLHEVAEGNSLVLLGVVETELRAFVQKLAVCRQRLEMFADLFRATVKNEVAVNAATVPLPSPEDGEGPAEGVVVGGESLPPELVFRFDRSFQHEVLERQGGLWGVFSRDDAARRAADSPQWTPAALTEDLLIRARAAIQSVVKELNAAQLFLQTNGSPDQALAVLLAHVEAARPRLRPPAGWEHLVLALPEGPAGETLSGMIASALADVPMTVVATEEKVLLCYEAARCPVGEMVRALVGPSGAPLDLVRRLMMRLDVSWKLLEPATV